MLPKNRIVIYPINMGINENAKISSLVLTQDAIMAFDAAKALLFIFASGIPGLKPITTNHTGISFKRAWAMAFATLPKSPALSE